MRTQEQLELEVEMGRSYVKDATRQLANLAREEDRQFLQRYLRESQTLVARLERNLAASCDVGAGLCSVPGREPHPSHAALVPRARVCHLPSWKDDRLNVGGPGWNGP